MPQLFVTIVISSGSGGPTAAALCHEQYPCAGSSELSKEAVFSTQSGNISLKESFTARCEMVGLLRSRQVWIRRPQGCGSHQAENMVRYLGIEADDAFLILGRVDI